MTGGPTSARKLDHLRICCETEVEAGDAGFGDVRLVHDALPECDMDRVSTATRFLGHRFEAPLDDRGHDGGHPEATPIKRTARGRCRTVRPRDSGRLRARRARRPLARAESTRWSATKRRRRTWSRTSGSCSSRDHGQAWADQVVESAALTRLQST